MITFMICVFIFGLGIVFIRIGSENFGPFLCFIAIIVFIVNIFVFTITRGNKTKEYYEIDKAKRHIEEYDEKQIDSINEYIYKTKYYNKTWFQGQYIPDEIDTIKIIEKPNTLVWDTIIKQSEKINSY